MKIRGKLTYMVPFEEYHLYDQRYFEWIRDQDVVRYIGREELLTGITFTEAEAYVKQLWANDYCFFFAVHHKKNGNFIGTAKVNFMNERGSRYKIADIGIMLGDRTYWGFGLSTDVLRAISAYSFDILSARKLTAGAYSVNSAVIKAFRRIGYIEDGRLRKHLPINDNFCDQVLLSCFESELIRD